MIKSILGGKSKNLFDISKVITSNVVKRNGNSLICSSYGTSIGTLGSICPTLKPSDTITVSFKCTSEGAASNFMSMSNTSGGLKIFVSGETFSVSEVGLSAQWYLYSTDWEHRDLPNKTTYSDIQVEVSTTATEYVPHELTSYKSIMKVSDVMQVVNKPVANSGMSLIGKSITISGITCHYLEDGTGVTLTGTTSTSYAIFEFGIYKKPIIGHKYLWFCQHSNAGDVINKAYIELKYIDKDGKDHWFSGTEQVYTLSEYAEKFEFHPIVKDNTTCNGFTFKPQLFDLTEMFGAGNEPKTVAEFKAKFPNDYYPYSPSCFVTSFDERMPCKTKNLINSQQIYQISQHMNVTIWQGEVNYVCTFSYELAMFEPNNGGAALFEFTYSNGTYSYIAHRDKYTVLSQITDSKKLTRIRLFNWSDVKGILSNIQLEKGTTATDYVPYGYV